MIFRNSDELGDNPIVRGELVTGRALEAVPDFRHESTREASPR